jgi:hypothetical protein
MNEKVLKFFSLIRTFKLKTHVKLSVSDIIHAYDNVSDENIWGIVINHLPRLRSDVEHHIKGNAS